MVETLCRYNLEGDGMTALSEHGFNNLAYSNTAQKISATDLTIPLIPLGGASFSGWDPGKELYLTLTNANKDIEIVKVTDIFNDSLIVERGQDGTTAQAWEMGTIICQRGVAADFSGFLQKGVFRTDAVNPNGVYQVNYPGERFYQAGTTECTKRWFIGVEGTIWNVLAGDSVCMGDFEKVSITGAPDNTMLFTGLATDGNGTVISTQKMNF